MNPLLPMEIWIPLMLALAFLLFWTSRPSMRALAAPWNGLSTTLRAATLIAMGVLLLNPGRYAPRSADEQATAWVLVDRSASMATGDRLTQAVELARSIEVDSEVNLRIAPVSGSLEAAVDKEDLDDLTADGDATDLESAISAALDAARGDPRPCRGILVLSDGISLSSGDRADAIGLAARAARIPIHARILGEPPAHPDLILDPSRPLTTVTAGADRPLHGRVRSRHLPPVRVEVRLLDEANNVRDTTRVDLSADSESAFELRTGKLPRGLHTMTIEVVPVDGETRTDNNRQTVRVNAMDLSLNVLLLEGVPHWDSKFLSQWLRKRRGIELTTLHRLSDNRWFRVNPGGSPEADPEGGLLPGEENDFREYDVILVGRGLDYIATSRTTAALHAFVRDHGGVLVFTRGRPVTTPHAAIESMLPVRWLEETSSERQARPAPAGIRSGLFGDLLPGADDPLWDELPPLRGLHRLRITDGMAVTLMEATLGLDDRDPWAALISRRVGNGQVLLLNGEGMWHWDFQPGVAREEKWYGHYWTQLLLWVMRNARFQPGVEHSVEWSPSPVTAGEPVDFRVRHRLDEKVNAGALQLKQPDGEAIRLPLYDSGGTATARWTAPSPGLWGVSVIGQDSLAEPLRYLHVPAPPSEKDELIPRSDPLAALAKASGGRLLDTDALDGLFERDIAPAEAADTEAVWNPHWTQPWILLALVALPAWDWGLRRRRGLI